MVCMYMYIKSSLLNSCREIDTFLMQSLYIQHFAHKSYSNHLISATNFIGFGTLQHLVGTDFSNLPLCTYWMVTPLIIIVILNNCAYLI